jgi:hypothetical protein
MHNATIRVSLPVSYLQLLQASPAISESRATQEGTCVPVWLVKLQSVTSMQKSICSLHVKCQLMSTNFNQNYNESTNLVHSPVRNLKNIHSMVLKFLYADRHRQTWYS